MLKGIENHILVIPKKIPKTFEDEFKANPEFDPIPVRVGQLQENYKSSEGVNLEPGDNILYEGHYAVRFQFKDDGITYDAVKREGIIAYEV